eukprot:Seg205.8 transcript_id=Seg205.8/GoldUCD/mRNA.D3Y31 product=Frizzled-4 protein_id=Seg205.8/GoldUCD/D3Y31
MAVPRISFRRFLVKSSSRFSTRSRANSTYRPSMTMVSSRLQMCRVYLLTFLVFGTFVLEGSCHFHDLYEETPWKCENITSGFCKKMKYNVTHMPNILNNANQVHAQMELVTYIPLVRVKCSSELELFLCSVYIPYCTEKVRQPIMACRTLCERVYKSCFPTMSKYGFGWPSNLNCSRFPPKNDHHNMCIDSADMNQGPTSTKSITKTAKPVQKDSGGRSNPQTVSRGEEVKPDKNIKGSKKQPPIHHGNEEKSHNNSKETALIPAVNMKSTRKYCRMKYARNGQNYVFIDRAKSCALICNDDGVFTRKEKAIVDSWLTGLSYLCASLSLLALIIVLGNMKSIFYPERAIIYITFSYLAFSGAYIVRINVGREKIGCDFDMGRHYTIQDGSGNIGCATTFLLTYLFSMAQSIWWVMMTLTWFLCGGMKWKAEAIRSCSVYFHVAAWGVPCGKTVIILMLRKIDVDELTGLCYVGNRLENISALRGFVVGPLFTYLIMGTTFLIAGFVALFKIRPISNSNPSEGAGADSKIEQPLLPIGIFAALHTILSTVILASYFYEYVNRESWFTKVESPGANFEVFLLRLIMVFAVGLLSALWIICIHTPRTWNKLVQKFSKNNENNDSPAQLEPLRGNGETPV